MQKNIPVLIRDDTGTTPYVFPDFTCGGYCTARTKQGRRCGNIAWDEGQVSSYQTVFVNDRVVHVLGEMPSDANRRYFTQRCRVHDNPHAAAYCAPEWEPFDPHRHPELSVPATVRHLFDPGQVRDEVPPLAAIATALRSHFTTAECRHLADRLVEPAE